ncbi:MAG TPA: cyclic pyranopterin monophosphate synthase MoaC [Gemmatimonadales bacterium]|nr:cyclic pyranopterin monophosphate synthase MoaC [Gemmatimonadales bacterium]
MKLSHLDAEGRARMVDVGDKPVSDRQAVARGAVSMSREAYQLVAGEGVPKGDVLAVAEVAGVMGAKRTGELVPLCHPLGLDHVQVEARLDPELPGVQVTAAVRVTGRTGVEMEALTAVAVACLTVYDMVKAVDKGMVIQDVRLVSKTKRPSHGS